MIRLASRLESDIENEASIASAMQRGNNRNIVRIFDHGWLTRSGEQYAYFMDMERCAMTLADYIEYLNDTPPRNFNLEALKASKPFYISRDPSFPANPWPILENIAEGLKFMHDSGYVHRDIKPSNGTNQNFLSLI